MNLGWLNAGPDHLSHVENSEESTNIDDVLVDAQLFHVDMTDGCYAPIIQFFATGVTPEDMSTSQKKKLVMKASHFQLIVGQLYKLIPNEILRWCILPHEQGPILEEAHAVIAGGHYGGRSTARKVLHAGLWCPTLHNDVVDYARSCDVCQRVGKPSRKDDMSLVP